MPVIPNDVRKKNIAALAVVMAAPAFGYSDC
jgi:hypothetical protein